MCKVDPVALVAGDEAALSFVRAVHEISQGTLYKSLGNGRLVCQWKIGPQDQFFHGFLVLDR